MQLATIRGIQNPWGPGMLQVEREQVIYIYCRDKSSLLPFCNFAPSICNELQARIALGIELALDEKNPKRE